jgi:hypothetical protein
MSVIEISGRASMGAMKKPWMMHLAIHSPLLETYALPPVSKVAHEYPITEKHYLQTLVPW